MIGSPWRTRLPLAPGSFLTIDVETANPNPSSICQIAVVRFEDGVVSDTWQQLVDPGEPFAALHTSLHGIDHDKVTNAPSFPQIMGTLSDLLTGNVVASHMPFDRIAIQSAIAMHSLASVECFWLDTAVVARRVWPRFAKRGYGLKTLATWCGIEFRHHNAVEDAIAAGLIFSRALEDSGKDIEEWIAHPFTSKFDADPTLSDKRKAQRWDPAMWGTENKIDAFLSTDAKKRGV